MADSKQTSDAAQTGPGTKVTSLSPKSPYVPAPKPSRIGPRSSVCLYTDGMLYASRMHYTPSTHNTRDI